MMLFRFRSSLMIILGLSVVPGLSHAGGSTVCLVADPVWMAGHTATEEALDAGVDAMATTVGQQATLTTENILSAVKVLTSQRSSNGERESLTEKQVTEALASTYVSLSASEQLLAAYDSYGPQGQAVGSCETVTQIKRVQDSFDDFTSRASEIIMNGDIDARPGGVVSVEDALSRRAAIDDPRASSVLALFDDSASPAVVDAFMNNVIGLPVRKESVADAPVASALQLLEARESEALRSPAMASLAAVRAMREDHGHFGAGAGALSVDESLSWLIARYGGGDGHAEWSAALVTKSEAGLVKEIARLRSISLTLQQQRTRADERMQAIMATELAVEIRK